jgi:hypothetical protein
MTEQYQPEITPNLMPTKTLKRPIWVGLLLTPFLTYLAITVLILIGYGISEGYWRATMFASGALFILVLCLCLTYAGAFIFGLPYLLFLQRKNWLNTKNVLFGGGFLSGSATAIIALTDTQQPMQTALIGGFFGITIGVVLGYIFCYLTGITSQAKNIA